MNFTFGVPFPHGRNGIGAEWSPPARTASVPDQPQAITKHVSNSEYTPQPSHIYLSCLLELHLQLLHLLRNPGTAFLLLFRTLIDLK